MDNNVLFDKQSSWFADDKFEKYNECPKVYDPIAEGLLDAVPQKIKAGCNEYAKKSLGNVLGALSTCLPNTMTYKEISGRDGMGFIDILQEQWKEIEELFPMAEDEEE